MNEKLLMTFLPMLVKAFNLPPNLPEVLAQRFESMQRFVLAFCEKYDQRLMAVEASNQEILKNQQEILRHLRQINPVVNSDAKNAICELAIKRDAYGSSTMNGMSIHDD